MATDLPTLPSDNDCLHGTQDWPHAPPHRLQTAGVFFLTARTSKKAHLLASPEARGWIQGTLFDLADHYGWRLEAWAVLSNHYHLVTHSPPLADNAAESLGEMIRHLHSLTTKELNRRDGQAGRSRLWQNFRETHLTHQRSYLARLHYVHQNAVHHGLVTLGSHWKWCSASAFKEAVTPAWLKTVTRFRYDEIALADDDM